MLVAWGTNEVSMARHPAQHAVSKIGSCAKCAQVQPFVRCHKYAPAVAQATASVLCSDPVRMTLDIVVRTRSFVLHVQSAEQTVEVAHLQVPYAADEVDHGFTTLRFKILELLSTSAGSGKWWSKTAPEATEDTF